MVQIALFCTKKCIDLTINGAILLLYRFIQYSCFKLFFSFSFSEATVFMNHILNCRGRFVSLLWGKDVVANIFKAVIFGAQSVIQKFIISPDMDANVKDFHGSFWKRQFTCNCHIKEGPLCRYHDFCLYKPKKKDKKHLLSSP